MAGTQHGLHLLLGLRQGHHQRPLAVGGQAITLIGRGVFLVPKQLMRAQMGLQRLHHLGLALCSAKQCLLVWFES